MAILQMSKLLQAMFKDFIALEDYRFSFRFQLIWLLCLVCLFTQEISVKYIYEVDRASLHEKRKKDYDLEGWSARDI